MKIAVAGLGYVGLSLAVLLAQHNEVRALDVVPEKVGMLDRFESPIRDAEIERFLGEAAADFARLRLRVDVGGEGCDEAETYCEPERAPRALAHFFARPRADMLLGVRRAGFDAAARHPDRKAGCIVLPSAVVLHHRRAAEFARPDDERR